MRHSFRAFSIVLTASVSLIAIIGAATGPAGATTPDIEQQQARVDQLQSKAEGLRQEAQTLGGSRTVRESINNVKTRINELDDDIAHTEERIDKMKENKADLDRIREEVANESVFGVGDAAEAGVKHKVLEVVEEKLSHNAGRAVGALGWAVIFAKVGGKMYYRWVRKSDLRAQGLKESNSIRDRYRFIRFAQEERNRQSANLKRLEEIQKEEQANNALIATERDKLRQMNEPQPAVKDADTKREWDHPGDEKLRRESREYWRERNKGGVTPSRTISFGGGYLEADSPQQFIGRVVVGGNDTAMIYTSPALAGFYAQAEADIPWEQSIRYAGEFGGFRLAARYSDVDGDEFRSVEADPTITTGFVWIDPLDPGVPFAVGLGSTNLAWEARTSTSEIDAAAMALYMEYRSFSPELTGGIGVGVMADYRNTEHRTRIESLDFAGFAIDENYNFETFGLGPRVEARLDWNGDPAADGPYPSFGGTLRAFAAGIYDWRSSEVSQRATGPFFGGFDYAQRVNLDDDGFNFRYGVDATVDLKFDARTTAFLKVGWQGQSDAPTIVPADGSFAPGAPIRADTRDASEWFIGGGVRIEF